MKEVILMLRRIVMVLLVGIMLFSAANAEEIVSDKLESEIVVEPGWFEITQDKIYGFIRSESICIDVSNIDHNDYREFIDIYGKPVTLGFNGVAKLYLPKGGYYQSPMNQNDYYLYLQEAGLEETYPLYNGANQTYLLKMHISSLNSEISQLKYWKTILTQKLEEEGEASSLQTIQELNEEVNRLNQENNQFRIQISKLENTCKMLLEFVYDIVDNFKQLFVVG